MIRALYSASSGMVAQTVKQDITANNIANSQTVGFKRQRVVTSTFAETLDDQYAGMTPARRPPYPGSPVAPSTVSAEASLDTTAGPLEVTGNSLDFAIAGSGSFEVKSASTGTRLTRAGDFRLGPQGELLTSDGSEVQGRSGSIRLPKEGKVEVADDGTIRVNDTEVDKIKLVNDKPGETRLIQGSLEQSNVSIVGEMVEMIANMRSFEANQRMIQSVDRTLDKLINEAGKV